METKNLEKVYFENRAWTKPEYPRLHMKSPEKFKYTEIQNFEPIEREIHLEIVYHHGESERLRTDRWYLHIYIYNGKDCSGRFEIFSSIKEIKEYIKKKYNKEPILPER